MFVTLKRACHKTVGLGSLVCYLVERREFSIKTFTLAKAPAQIVRKRLCLTIPLRSDLEPALLLLQPLIALLLPMQCAEIGIIAEIFKVTGVEHFTVSKPILGKT